MPGERREGVESVGRISFFYWRENYVKPGSYMFTYYTSIDYSLYILQVMDVDDSKASVQSFRWRTIVKGVYIAEPTSKYKGFIASSPTFSPFYRPHSLHPPRPHQSRPENR